VSLSRGLRKSLRSHHEISAVATGALMRAAPCRTVEHSQTWHSMKTRARCAAWYHTRAELAFLITLLWFRTLSALLGDCGSITEYPTSAAPGDSHRPDYILECNKSPDITLWGLKHDRELVKLPRRDLFQRGPVTHRAALACCLRTAWIVAFLRERLVRFRIDAAFLLEVVRPCLLMSPAKSWW
jgi:hypothetical protein